MNALNDGYPIMCRGQGGIRRFNSKQASSLLLSKMSIVSCQSNGGSVHCTWNINLWDVKDLDAEEGL